MIKFTGEYLYRSTPQMVLKCKRCHNEFAIIWNSNYVKSVCYCPSCGQAAQEKHHYDPLDYEDYYNEVRNG